MHRLGVDIGGVIIDRSNDHSDTSFFSENFLASKPSPGVFEALSDLSHNQFQENIWLVSKCGPVVQEKSMAWLENLNFFDTTGIDREHVLFTLTRIGKLAIAKNLELTHFVDDRLEVLGYMVDSVMNLYLFNPVLEEVESSAAHLPRVTVVHNWIDTRDSIVASLLG